jgi:Tol biopolymer transport system component
VNRRAALRLFAGTGIGLSIGASSNSQTRAQNAIPGRILFVRDTGIWVWNGGDPTHILSDDTVGDACWSPDGSQIALIRYGNSYSDLYILNVAANQIYQVTYNLPPYEEGTPEYVQTSAWALDVDWSASGLMAFMSDYGSPDGTFQLWLVDDPSSGAYLAPAAQYEDNIDSLSLSADGSLAAYTVQERQLDGTSLNRAILRDLSDGVAYPLAESVNAFDPAIAPNQETVAIAVRAEDDSTDIYLVDRASGELTRMTEQMQATNPAWSPDGSWLGFVRMVNYEFEVWATPMTGTTAGEPVELFKASGFDARSGISWAR